ncbi:MAG: hypothetical protein E7211_19250 [Clostridium lundense]|nr:hypothetical protein [Clostridium lundense]
MKNKHMMSGFALLGIALFVYVVVMTVVPLVHNDVFWAAFTFGVAALLLMAFVFHISFNRGTEMRSKFYGFSVARVGVFFVTVQLIAAVLFMVFAESVPLAVCVSVCVVLLALAAAGTIASDTVRDVVEQWDQGVSADVSTVKRLRARAAALVAMCADADTRRELESFAEALRLSDPISNAASVGAELELEDAIEGIGSLLGSADYLGAKAQCQRARIKLVERNALCKAGK